MNKKLLALTIASNFILGTGVVFADAQPAPDLPPDVQANIKASDAGNQLQQYQNDYERQRIAQQIEEDRGKNLEEMENQKGGSTEGQDLGVGFTLKHIVTDPSTVLTDEEIDTLTKDYIDKEIHIKDLYELVQKINDIYVDKGYLTCKAFLEKQEVKDGTVKISLAEGTTGTVSVTNNKSTREKYITNRLHLLPGQVANINQLNRDLLRFNATNDVQLRIDMQKGAADGTTDYVIEAFEPQKQAWTIFTDNGGNFASGDWRQGIFYNYRSLTGQRDSLNLGYLHSQGSNAGSLGYSYHVGNTGARFNFSINRSVVNQKRNISKGKVYSNSTSYVLSYIQPWVVTRDLRSEVSFEYNYQKSASDYLYNSAVVDNLRTNLTNETLKDFTIGFAMTNYGPSYVWYNKYSFTFGKESNTPTAFADSSQSYRYHKLASYYRKDYQHGQSIGALFQLQKSCVDGLVSARQFYIGGQNTVRGYKENLIGSDGGYFINLEYSMPLRDDRTVNGFVFMDYGRLLGETAQSAAEYTTLSSMGFGVRANFNKNYFASLTLGHPFKRNLGGGIGDAGSYRINFVLSAQF